MEQTTRRRTQRPQSEGILERTFRSNIDELKSIPKRINKAGLVQKGKFDVWFLVILSILLVFGLIMLFSASGPKALQEHGNRYHFISRQLLFMGGGIIAMLFFSILKTELYRIFIKPFLAVVTVLLLYAKIFGYKGRWISLGGVTFQPSEFAKFGLVVYIAHIISTDPECVKKVDKFVGKILFPFAFIEALVVIEPHLSATILIFLISMTVIIVGGLSKRIIVTCLMLGGAAVLLFLMFGASYWQSRIDTWFDPYSDPTGSTYQTLQSLRAIGSGGLLGVGLGESTQKYLWLPEPQNDFIFSVICEELGFVGGFVVLALFMIFVWRGFTIAMKCKSKYNALLVVGLVSQVGYQALLNAAVATNAAPNTGISLPFFSYGGTSMLVLLAEMGIILSASRTSKIKKI